MGIPRDSKSQLSVYVWFFEVIIAWGFISFLIWVCLTPKNPVYMISNVYIPALDRRNSTLHYNKFIHNTSIFLDFEISNPNKGFGIYHDDIHVTFCHGDSIIGNKSLPMFYQGYKESTTWEVQVNPGQKFWRRRGGALYVKVFKVCLKTAVKFKYKIFNTMTKHYPMDFEAYVPINLDGRMLGDKHIQLQHKIRKPGWQSMGMIICFSKFKLSLAKWVQWFETYTPNFEAGGWKLEIQVGLPLGLCQGPMGSLQPKQKSQLLSCIFSQFYTWCMLFY